MQPMRKHITSAVVKTKIKEGIYVSSNLSMNGQDTISTVKKYNHCWGQTAFAGNISRNENLYGGRNNNFTLI